MFSATGLDLAYGIIKKKKTWLYYFNSMTAGLNDFL